MFKNRLITVMIIIVFLLLIIMGFSATMGNGTAGPVRNTTNIIITPFQKIFTSISNSAENFARFWSQMSIYKQTNDMLLEKIEVLKQENRELHMLRTENDMLSEQLDLKKAKTEYQLEAAAVIAKESGNWYSVFTINKGEISGIKIKDVVISKVGLVGYISEVGSNYSKVTTILDTNCSVGAFVLRTMDYAIVEGDLTLSVKGYSKLMFMKNEAGIIEGDEIITSGLGGTYPKGILIGTVEKIEQNGATVSETAKIKPAVDFRHISYVSVIKGQ